MHLHFINVIFYVIVFLGLLSCSKESESVHFIQPLQTPALASELNPVSNPLQNPPEKEIPCDSDQDSYPFEECVPLVRLNEITENKNDFIYMDPKNKKGASEKFITQYRQPSHYMDLSKFSENQKISENFVLGDFLRVQNGRYGIYQTLAIENIQNIRNSVERPLKINSGYRSPGYNKKISGSADWSRHMYGDAADISALSSSQIKEIQRECEKTTPWIFLYSNHVHCDWRDEPLDEKFYGIPELVLSEQEFKRKQKENIEKIHENIIQAQLEVKKTQKINESGENEKFIYLNVISSLMGEEQEGELFVEWNIKNLSQLETISGYGNNIHVKVPEGPYRVHVTVGGYKTLESSIFVE